MANILAKTRGLYWVTLWVVVILDRLDEARPFTRVCTSKLCAIKRELKDSGVDTDDATAG